MDEERVKSALEIAMERLSSMPELTPEEITQQKEKQFRPVGQAISRRYLMEMIDGKGMLEELARYGDESGRVVRTACVSSLCSSIQVEDFRNSGRAIAGLAGLAGSPAAFRREADSLWERIWNGYKKKEEATIRKFESSALITFASIGISGPAIRPNLRDNDHLQAELESIRRSLDPELEEFRSALAAKILEGGR